MAKLAKQFGKSFEESWPKLWFEKDLLKCETRFDVKPDRIKRQWNSYVKSYQKTSTGVSKIP